MTSTLSCRANRRRSTLAGGGCCNLPLCLTNYRSRPCWTRPPSSFWRTCLRQRALPLVRCPLSPSLRAAPMGATASEAAPVRRRLSSPLASASLSSLHSKTKHSTGRLGSLHGQHPHGAPRPPRRCCVSRTPCPPCARRDLPFSGARLLRQAPPSRIASLSDQSTQSTWGMPPRYSELPSASAPSGGRGRSRATAPRSTMPRTDERRISRVRMEL
mmetsp:Transcript_29333/g.64266  ORF Transcript_29333/g.64266 Transcript_29333/m.64266 type:complete len:215 (-) Transcript_29333:241-885(-)